MIIFVKSGFNVDLITAFSGFELGFCFSILVIIGLEANLKIWPIYIYFYKNVNRLGRTPHLLYTKIMLYQLSYWIIYVICGRYYWQFGGSPKHQLLLLLSKAASDCVGPVLKTLKITVNSLSWTINIANEIHYIYFR